MKLIFFSNRILGFNIEALPHLLYNNRCQVTKPVPILISQGDNVFYWPPTLIPVLWFCSFRAHIRWMRKGFHYNHGPRVQNVYESPHSEPLWVKDPDSEREPPFPLPSHSGIQPPLPSISTPSVSEQPLELLKLNRWVCGGSTSRRVGPLSNMPSPLQFGRETTQCATAPSRRMVNTFMLPSAR